MRQQGYTVSRRRIGRIMRRYNLISSYTKKKYKPQIEKCNDAATPNILQRDFNRKQALDAVVSDLTYVRVGGDWCYICLVIDLWNREIIGWSAGRRKSAELVQEALYRIPYSLNHINIFHSDRGKEFDNQLIDDVIAAFTIERSLSKRGCPYDNAVVEATNKALKVEFIYQHKFTDLEELQLLLFDYIHWYNNVRLHSSLGYKTPASLRRQSSSTVLYHTTLSHCPKKC